MEKPNIFLIVSLFIVGAFVNVILYAQDDNINKRTSFFNENWLNAIVSIETLDDNGDKQSLGTGFLIKTGKGRVVLVTASHVVREDSGRIRDNLQYRRIDLKDEELIITEKQLADINTGSWFFSTSYDIACRFFAFRSDKKGPTVIPIEKTIPTENLQPGASLLILGFTAGLKKDFYNKPLVRRGIVSQVEKDKIIAEVFVFPGNSGGPVIYVPPFKVSGDIKSPLVNEERLVGIITNFISYIDVAISSHTKRPRITFEENSGLSEVIPAKALEELISRDDVKQQEEKIINKSLTNQSVGLDSAPNGAPPGQ